MSVNEEQLFRTCSASHALHKNTYVDQFGEVSLLEIVKDRGIVQVCQVGHILTFFVFWRIQLLQQILLQSFLLLFDEK